MSLSSLFTGENAAYVEKSKTLMEEREAQIFGKGRAFATATDTGWNPPRREDADAIKATHSAVVETGGSG